ANAPRVVICRTAYLSVRLPWVRNLALCPKIGRAAEPSSALPFKFPLRTELGGAPDLFHILTDLLSGIVGHFERHVGYPTAALQNSFHGLTHHVALYGRKLLRSSAGP